MAMPDAAAQHSVFRGIMCLSMHRCIYPETLFTQYVEKCTTDFPQTYLNYALWDRFEWLILGQVQGGLERARLSAFNAIS